MMNSNDLDEMLNDLNRTFKLHSASCITFGLPIPMKHDKNFHADVEKERSIYNTHYAIFNEKQKIIAKTFHATFKFLYQ